MAPTITYTGFNEVIGVAEIRVDGLTAGQRLAALSPFGTIRLIEDVDRVGSHVFLDLDCPLGDTAHYVILPNRDSLADEKLAEMRHAIPGGVAFLRSMRTPVLNARVNVVSTGVERETARQTVHDVLGRRPRIVVWNSRSSRSGTVTLVTYTRQEREQIEVLLDKGEPLRLNVCSGIVFEPCMMAVGDVEWERVDNLPSTFLCHLTYEQVTDSDFLGDADDYVPPQARDVTYSTLAATTWQKVRDRGNYLGVYFDGPVP